jgi:hypothetical protein
MEYNNENSGILFKNDKATNEKDPQYTGKINVNGTDYRLACWIKEGKNGKFMSLKVSELNANGSEKPTTIGKRPTLDLSGLSDDAPF